MIPLIEHRLNPLHIYCRLRKIFPKPICAVITRVYEYFIRAILYGFKECNK
jgi:hypothetical protein